MSTDSDASDNRSSIGLDVKGDRNQVIGHVSNSTVINSVETLNQTVQQLPRSLESARYSLPVDAADFTGREFEIQQIESDLQSGWVVAIAGMAGVGKSALAVRVAHRLKAQFPGGQIYLNLRGADTEPLTVDAALESLLRALGVDPAQIPVEQADKVALYRSRFAPTPTLVLLDNASDAQQVENLLPGSGACLITSRRQLDGLAGSKCVNLEALSEEQALELFQKVLPSQRVQTEIDAARQIVNYCGRLPLALRIAAATLAMRSWQRKRLVDYAQQLVDERQRLDRLKLENLDIRASFELSYRELDPAAAQLLGWLGLLPGDFGTDILIPLTDEQEASWQMALAALVDGRLVDPLATDSAAERYLLHDLMRLFALEKLETQAELTAVQATKVRLVQWCENQADTWENALNPKRRRQWAESLAESWAAEDTGNPPISAIDLEPKLLQLALMWFEAEREILVQAFTWAAETQQWQASVTLAANLVSFFSLRGYWDDWVSTHQQALTAAQQANNLRGEGQTLNNLGHVYQKQGKWNKVIDCCQQSLQICRILGDVQEEGLSLNNLGNAYQRQGNWGTAIDYYQQSLEICRANNYVYGEGLSLGNLGNVYQRQGNWNEAIDYYQQSLKIKRATSDVYGEGQTLNNLGNVYQRQGNWNEAIDYYQQSLQICRRIGDIYGEGLSLGNLGNVYQGQDNWDKAIDYYQQSLEICRRIGDVPSEGQTLNNLGVVYQKQGKWNEATDCYKQSLKICQAIGDVQGEGSILQNLGLMHKLHKRLDQAVALWSEALTKLHPHSPEHATVNQWLQEADAKPRRFDWLGWLLPLGILLFLGWKLFDGHWMIALLGVLALVVWQWLRRRR